MLWNAHAGQLWRRFSIHLRREVAKRAGLSQRRFRDHARVSFAKVAEYQKRGAVHFHAVIRLDGPGGADTPPPPWATAELLTDAIQAAATKARVDGPVIDGRAEWRRAQTTTAERPADTTYVLAHWVFAGTGLSDTEAWLAASLEPAPGTEGEPTA